MFSGQVGTAHHQGGAQAYRFGGGGTEYRDVGTIGNDGAVTGGGFAHHLRTVTSPLGETTQFIRGSGGRIERVVYPDSGEKLISYGDDAQPNEVTLPQGTVLSFTHDAAFRETSRTSNLGEQRAFTYGPGDRIETMTDNTGTTTYHYDASGRFTGLTYPYGGSVRYDRDVLDRVQAVRVKATASAAEIVTAYDYDENGNLERITDPQNGVTQYVYDEVDRLAERTLPNGVTTTYGYDDRDRVLSVVHRSSGGTVLASVTYVRSPSGEPTRITREDGSYVALTYDDALRVDTETYYNAAGQLLDANDYDYDEDGNRIAKDSLSGGYESYAYEPGFQLTSITAAAGNESYDYDGGGRLTALERGGVEGTLEYNSDDKLTRVVSGGGEVVRYTYDGVGRRVGTQAGATTLRYLVAPNVGDGFETPQAVTDATGNVLASYVFAGEHPIARIGAGGAVEYYLQDAMGSVIGMADAAGAASATIKYDAFGNVTSSSGAAAGIPSSIGTDFRYHGMQRDAATGLYHVRARTYDARTGRFTSRDPVSGVASRPETLNPYVFNHNSPHVWRDPSGRMSLLEMMGVSAIIGVLTSIALPALNNHLNSIRAYKSGADARLAGVITNYGAAWGDTVSFGLGRVLRDLGGIPGVDVNSPEYYAGVATGLAMQYWAGFFTAGASASGMAVYSEEIAPQAVDHIVLGISNQGLEQTAQQVGGRILAAQGEGWRIALLEAISNPSVRITVSLRGFSGANAWDKIMGAAMRGAGPNAYATEWEMYQLYSAGRLKAVTFLDDAGAVIPNPFL